jgi:hypothetical protein
MELIDGSLQGVQLEWANGRSRFQHYLGVPGKICTIRQTKGAQNAGKLVSCIRTRTASVLVRRIGPQYAMRRAQDIQPFADGFPAPRP